MREERGPDILPLESRALGLRYATLKPRSGVRRRTRQDADIWAAEEAPSPTPATPSTIERRLRARLADAVARQVVEDEGAPEARPQMGFGPHAQHRYNAVLKRVTGRGRAEMGAPELEAALAWLERNRLGDHLHLLDGDARYAWDARREKARARARARRAKSPDPRQSELGLS